MSHAHYDVERFQSVHWYWRALGLSFLPVIHPRPPSTRSPNSHRARVRGSWIDADGVIQKSQKARLFAAVAFENLEQDIARGNGEYVRSLAVLMNIPAGEQDEFRSLSQGQYSRLFASDRRTAESLLTTLISNRNDR